MVYRHTEIQALCGLCGGVAPGRCRHCDAAYCLEHLSGGACFACIGELWSLERTIVHRLGSIYGVLALPVSLLAVMLSFSGATAWLGFTILFLVPVGYFSIPRFSRPIVRRALAGKSLAQTSKRLLPATAEPATPNTQLQSDIAYERRRKHSKRPQKRLKALGRGFYYD